MTALNLQQAVIEFWESKVTAKTEEGQRFTANDLRHYVNVRNFGTAPASADRVMRQLRQQGKINYVLTNRSRSLYTAVPVEVKENAQSTH